MESAVKTESPSCAGCLNNIGNNDYVSALNQEWHKDCFRCSVCDGQLSSWYLEKGGLLFCQRDYWARYGELCQQCDQVMTGPVMAAGRHRFHPECFSCARCRAHIEPGEPYALRERSQLYCGTCYSNSVNAASERRHAIRVVEGAPRHVALQPRGDHLSVTRGGCVRDKMAALLRAALRTVCLQLACLSIDPACGLLLQVGDRVLEINGSPVRDHSARELRDLLADPDQLLQLTVEHNPLPANPSSEPPAPDESPPITAKQEEARQDIPDESIPREGARQFATDDGGAREVEDGAGKRERLFKRKGDAGAGRVMKRRQAPASPLLRDRDRSTSLPKLLDNVDSSSAEAGGVLRDLGRCRSFRADTHDGQRVFRACDLLQGELLGSGFFGEVYKVTHRLTHEVMVLKQLYRVDEDAQRNFLKEVAVLRSLKHSNVLRFIGVLYRDKRLHLVTEYVAGGTLHEKLHDKSTPLPWLTRVRFARDVAAGVGYLHRMNVIHRDLNSHNCLVREDNTVIVADFGLARIVQRTASNTLERRRPGHAPRRKRYTVVGNPYWMAPEMMNGNVYDEKVDVFSFGIILCEIIGRVSADPDFLPRRSDFGLNESLFRAQFCATCPEPLVRIAELACHLDPEHRPPFEVLEIWLETLVMLLSNPSSVHTNLLADILQYSQRHSHGRGTPECCQHQQDCRDGCCQYKDCTSRGSPRGCQAAGSACGGGIFCEDTCCYGCRGLRRSPSKVASVELSEGEGGVFKSASNTALLSPEPGRGRALGKCVSASHICAAQRPVVTVTNLSRSQNALCHTPAGYILRADGKNINITKVDDISEWLDPPPLKRTSPDSNLHISDSDNKSRKVEEELLLPAFLRNQSVEGLESSSKADVDAPLPFCRHFSIPDHCEASKDSDSSDEDVDTWYRSVKMMDKMDVDQPKNVLAAIVKKGENLLARKAAYDVSQVQLRNQECERKIPDVERRRFSIDEVNKNSVTAHGIKNLPKNVPVATKPAEKSNFFSKKLLSPKFSRLFKPNTSEVVRKSAPTDENKGEKSKSKFFIQRPASPSNMSRSSYRVRPLDDTYTDNSKKEVKGHKNVKESNVLKSDLKLASMGKPMTPIFRRNIVNTDFADGRFSYRRPKYDHTINEHKIDFGKHRTSTPATADRAKLGPLVRSPPMSNLPALATVVEKNREKIIHVTVNPKLPTKCALKDLPKKREPGISRSNYVSLANLKINNKGKDLEKAADKKSSDSLSDDSLVERVL